MPSVQLTLAEREIVKVVLEFLESRGLHISQVSLERETGLINGLYSDDALFLRQLIIDGQWDNALDFVEPLRNLPDFDSRQFRYLVTKFKYFELLCIKQEPGPMQDNDFTVEELVECLKDLEHICPSPEDYRQLCAMLTLPKLSDHADFKNWNPSSARVECFTKVYPLVTKFLPAVGNTTGSMQGLDNISGHASNDRLLQLAAKGLFYEACVDYCQGQAVRDKSVQGGPKLSKLLDARPKLSSTDLSLVSWLEALSMDQFSLPFEQKSLELKVEALKKPKLEAQWTEQILATPIKPGGQFPHAAVPSGKLKSAEKMSQSLILPSIASSMTASGFVHHRPALHAMSQSSAAVVGFSIRPSPPSQMQQSAQMQQSQMDALFETSDLTRSTRPEPPLSGIAVQQPLVHPNTLFDATPRQQLEEIARRSLPPSMQRLPSSLAPVPEGDTPTENIMEGSRLFQEFSSRQQRHSSQPIVDAVTYQMMQMSTHGQQQSPPTHHVYMSPQHRPSSVPTQSSLMSQPPAADYAPRRLQYPLLGQSATNGVAGGAMERNVQFSPICRMEDSQAIRAVAFHPSGRYFVIGTNSKQMHILKYPDIRRVIPGDSPRQAEVLLSRPKQHRGSVYCVGFNTTGELLATGSNDKTIRLMGFNADSCKIGAEMELTMHDGTVRDLVFMEDTISHTSLLISGGAGNCHIHLTDCATGQTFKSLAGHTAPILGLYTWGGCMFVSCSQDKTIRFWDLRCAQAVNLIAPGSKTASAPVTSVCVDPGGKLLVSGHEDASVMLYDVTASRVVQIFRPHGDEVRTVRFSPGTYYLLSGSYDKKVSITDMRGDLMAPLMYLPVAEHNDKVIQCRWHPHDFSFLSTSADRTAILWALPPPAV